MKLKFYTILLIFLSLTLVSCTTYYFKNEEFLIYESEDKKMTIEIDLGKKSNPYGKFYINEGDKILTFPCSFPTSSIRGFKIFNKDYKEDEDHYSFESYHLRVEFKQKKGLIFYYDDYDFMTLIDNNNPSNKVVFKNFFNINMNFTRIHGKEVRALSFFKNKWKSSENEIVFFNEYYNLYLKNIIRGYIKEEYVFINFFNENEFEITNKDEKVLLAGIYEENGRNIILRKKKTFNEYPDEIILKFERIKQGE